MFNAPISAEYTFGDSTGISISLRHRPSPSLLGMSVVLRRAASVVVWFLSLFLSRQFPPVSIIRPTATKGAATGALKGFTDDGLFIGPSAEFFEFLRDLAEDADSARRNV